MLTQLTTKTRELCSPGYAVLHSGLANLQRPAKRQLVSLYSSTSVTERPADRFHFL